MLSNIKIRFEKGVIHKYTSIKFANKSSLKCTESVSSGGFLVFLTARERTCHECIDVVSSLKKPI